MIGRRLAGEIGSSSSEGSAKGSEAAVTGLDMTDSLELGLCEARLAM